MKPRIFLSLLVLLLLVFPVTSIGNSIFGHVYVSETMGFAFRYPDHWRVMPEGDGYVVVLGNIETDHIRTVFYAPQPSGEVISAIQNDETGILVTIDGRDTVARVREQNKIPILEILIALDEDQYGLVTTTVSSPERLEAHELYLLAMAGTYELTGAMEPTITQADYLPASFNATTCEAVASLGQS